MMTRSSAGVIAIGVAAAFGVASILARRKKRASSAVTPLLVASDTNSKTTGQQVINNLLHDVLTLGLLPGNADIALKGCSLIRRQTCLEEIAVEHSMDINQVVALLDLYESQSTDVACIGLQLVGQWALKTANRRGGNDDEQDWARGKASVVVTRVLEAQQDALVKEADLAESAGKAVAHLALLKCQHDLSWHVHMLNCLSRWTTNPRVVRYACAAIWWLGPLDPRLSAESAAKVVLGALEANVREPHCLAPALGAMMMLLRSTGGDIEDVNRLSQSVTKALVEFGRKDAYVAELGSALVATLLTKCFDLRLLPDNVYQAAIECLQNEKSILAAGAACELVARLARLNERSRRELWERGAGVYVINVLEKSPKQDSISTNACLALVALTPPLTIQDRGWLGACDETLARFIRGRRRQLILWDDNFVRLLAIWCSVVCQLYAVDVLGPVHANACLRALMDMLKQQQVQENRPNHQGAMIILFQTIHALAGNDPESRSYLNKNQAMQGIVASVMRTYEFPTTKPELDMIRMACKALFVLKVG